MKAGLHLEMPSSNGTRDIEIVNAVKDGVLLEKDLDAILVELLDFIFKCDENLTKNKNIKLIMLQITF